MNNNFFVIIYFISFNAKFYSHKILTNLEINLDIISGNPVQVDINMYVRSMGPISEMDMVSVKYLIHFIDRVKRLLIHL